MKTVRGIARQITGKQVVATNCPDYYFIGPDHLEIPGGSGRKEQAIHEVLHWILAEDWQRDHPANIGYGHSMDDYEEKDPRCTPLMMERQELMVCHAQRFIYQMAATPFPTKGSCTYPGRTKGLTDDEVAWVTARCSAIEWTLLVSMARKRW